MHHAMRHGVPIVIAGDSEDKVETSARVQHARVGVNLRTGRPTPDAVRSAVQRILADPGYRARARRIGDAIAVAPGAAGLVDDIEAMLVARE
ncbi:glycosyltransferase [Microbacterium enclense]|uniref:glycosyltransferase n=1 Tax=Microbacterium enclense TaxID=993073 RepID=UPI0039C957AE